jgi:hypothetical protein
MFCMMVLKNNQTIFTRLWYFNIAYNIPTCIEHYLPGGHGKSIVKWLPDIVAAVWPRKQAAVLKFVDQCFIHFSKQRHPHAPSFHKGILSTHV